MLLRFPCEFAQITVSRGFGFIECGFLAPLQNFGGAHSLHNPVTDRGRVPAIYQNVGNVTANLKTSIRRVFGFAKRGSNQSAFPLSPNFKEAAFSKPKRDYLD